MRGHVLDTIVLLALTLGGGLAALWLAASTGLPIGPLWQDVLLVIAIVALTGACADSACHFAGIGPSSSRSVSASTG